MPERQVIQTPTRKVIVPTGQHLKWLEARNAVRDIGGLPSNVLHDDVLVYSNDWESLASMRKGDHYYPAWAKEVLVYPEVNGKFKKGIDVIDNYNFFEGRPWVFPASSIPEIAIGKEKVGLFVDPHEIEVSSKRVVILAKPESVMVLTPFLQKSGHGKVDDDTRVPLEAFLEGLSAEQSRYLARYDGQGVRPLSRYYYGVTVCGGNRRVDATHGYNPGLLDGDGGRIGVAYVELREAERK
jgi:hypothetical protein